MGTSETESCEGCLETQFKHLPPQLALILSLVKLQLHDAIYRLRFYSNSLIHGSHLIAFKFAQ